MSTITPQRVITTALAAGALVVPAALVPASAQDEREVSTIQGQVEIDLAADGRPVRASDTFTAPLGQARLVVDGSDGARVLVRVNGRAVPEAGDAARQRGRQEVDLSGYSHHGQNELTIQVMRGQVAMTVPYPTLVQGRPHDVDMEAAELAKIDEIIAAQLGPDAEDRYPGAVVLVAREGVVVHTSALGDAQTYEGDERLSESVPMTTETSFDLASITKVASTTAAIMRLVDRGEVDLDAPVSAWVPGFTGGGKETVTVRHLLTHSSGLWEWQPTYLHATSWSDAIDYVSSLDLRYPVGEARHYSDLGFMLLGEIVRAETGMPLEDYVRTQVHEPLGMARTAYTPGAELGPYAATSFGNPYEYEMIQTGQPYPILEGDVDDFDGWRDHTLIGEVNDGNAAYGFEGVAGHAGLFAPASELAIYGQTLLNGGGYDTFRLAGEDTVNEFTHDQFARGQGLGFWTNRLAAVDGPDAGGVGHSGFTGTEFMVDYDRDLMVVLLTNRLHPGQPHSSVNPVWTDVLRAAVASIDE